MPLKWPCHSDKKSSWKPHQGHMTQVTQQRHKTKTNIWHAVKKAGSVKTHGADFLYDRRVRMAERWRKWAVDGAVQIKTRAERRVRGSYLVYFRTRNIKNIWPTDGAQWRNFPCCFPPKTHTSLTADGGIYEYLSVFRDERVVLGDELTLGWQDCGGDAAYLMTITIGTCV